MKEAHCQQLCEGVMMKNPIWFMPVKDLVTFTPLKQCRLKAAKSAHCGIRSFVLVQSLFCSTEKFIRFWAPSDHRTAQVGGGLERPSGSPFHGKGSLGGIVQHLVWSHPTALQQWGLYSVPREVVPLGGTWTRGCHVMMLAWKWWRC